MIVGPLLAVCMLLERTFPLADSLADCQEILDL